MANNTETFIIKLKDQFSKAVEKAGDRSDKTKAKIQGLSGAVGNLRNILGGVSVAFLGREIVQNLAEFEKFEAVLTNTLGSGSAAQKSLEMISDFAAKTPFAVDKLTGAYVKLANQGFVPTRDEMRKLGDLASSTGKDFDQLAEAVIDGQVGEFERLKEFGIRAKKSGDQVAFTFKGVTKNVKFTEKAMRDYILSLGDAQGVSGAMAAISATTGGQISNLGDKMTQLSINIGQKLKPAISGTIEVLSGTIDHVTELVNWLAAGGTGVDILTTAVGSLTAGFLAYKVAMIATNVVAKIVSITQLAMAAATATTGTVLQGATLWTKLITVAQWAWNAALTANPIGIVVAAIAALVAGIVIAWKRSETFRAVIMGLWAAIKQVGINIKDNFLAIPNLVIKAFMAIPTAIKQIFSGVGDLFSAIFSGDFSKIPDILKGIVADNALANVGKEFIKNQVEGAKKVAGAFGAAYDEEIRESAVKEAAKKKEKEKAVNTGVVGGSVPKIGKQKGLGSGLSEIKASAPKTFNINIGSLIKEQKISTTNLGETTQKIKEAVTNVLLTAVNDAQVIAE